MGGGPRARDTGHTGGDSPIIRHWPGRPALRSQASKLLSCRTMVHLLVVEDEEALARNIKVWLESSTGAFDVSVTGSAEGATQLLAEQRFDILLTDIRLPGMDGIELIRLASQRQPHLRIAVMTASGSPELSRLASVTGAMRFFNKPLDLEELYQTLVEVNSSHQGWSGVMGGLDLLDLTQLVALTHRSIVARVRHGDQDGLLAFVHGDLRHAHGAALEGEQAFFAMTSWPAGTYSEVLEDDPALYPANVRRPLPALMLEAARLREGRAQRSFQTPGA